MKKALCLIFCIALLALTLTACGSSDSGTPLFTVVDKATRENVTATFKNTDSGDTLEVKMTKKDLSGDSFAFYTCHADTALYDRVIIDSDGLETEELAYNDYCTAWDLTSGRAYPGTDPEAVAPKYERKTFDYQKRTKDILIRTPEDYGENPDEKYSVIYMTDGQNLFDRSATSTGSWAVAESALAMAENGGEKCIIVGIENADSWRDDELTPDIGEVLSEDYEDGHGEYFSDFVVDTVMPYINENYSVYTDREHTHICGSSSGGIESFYIAMEHPDKFSSVGALSPAFLLYSDETWVDYLSKKDFSENAPLVYLYCGNGKADQLEQQLYIGTVAMPDTLKKIGYPEDKVVMKLYEDGIHNEMYWRAVFPDYLKYAFPKTESAQ
ncbi:MAG: alpha/beta hydrolase [Ruminococcus sp.]|nr:alpha/beta hydrolase [Ruminococcus sp.]